MNTILVVDDDPHIVRALAITLKGQGYTVVTATDGQSALHSAAQRPVSVMILDLGLPDMDGKTVISALRGVELRTHSCLISQARIQRQSRGLGRWS